MKDYLKCYIPFGIVAFPLLAVPVPHRDAIPMPSLFSRIGAAGEQDGRTPAVGR